MRHPILLVHDEQTTLDSLVAAFDKAGFIGIPAASGQQALDYLQSGGRASVILLDEQAGWSAFRRAQQCDPALASIPVIAISRLQGSAATDSADEPIDVGLLITIAGRLCHSTADAARANTGAHQFASDQLSVHVKIASSTAEPTRPMILDHHLFPQTLPETNTDWLKLVATISGADIRTDDDPVGPGTCRFDGPPVREDLWMLQLAGGRINCELRYHGRYGVEYRLFRNNQFYEGQGFRTRTPAVQAAASVRRRLEDDGWSSCQSE